MPKNLSMPTTVGIIATSVVVANIIANRFMSPECNGGVDLSVLWEEFCVVPTCKCAVEIVECYLIGGVAGVATV